MATAYTSLLGLALPVTGELSGTWGDTVNDAITSLLDTAVAGTTSLTTDADATLTTTTGASNQARQAIILWNPASGTTTRNITAPAQSKIYTVINASGGTQSIVFRGAGPTTGVTIVKGESAVVAWNGTDFIKVSNTGGAASFTNVTVSGTTTLSGLTASTALALDASKNVVSVTNTGTGNNVLATSPTLVTPALGTPSSGVVTNLTGTASININGTVGATTASTGAFTTLSATGVTTVQAGSAGAPAITTSGDTNTGIFFPAADTIAFSEGGTEAMRLDSSGNLGLGVTPSAWASSGAAWFRSLDLQNGGAVASFQNGLSTQVITNAFFNGGSWQYKLNGVAGRYVNSGNTHQWDIAPSGTAGNAISFTQAMTLDASGNLGIGTSSPASKLEVRGADAAARFRGSSIQYLDVIATSGGAVRLDANNGNAFVFAQNTTEQMRLDSSGNLGLGVTPSAWQTSNSVRALQFNAGNIWSFSTVSFFMSQNAFFNSLNQRQYITSAAATEYEQVAGAHKWFNAPSGTAGNTISFTQAMTLDGSGNLLVGATVGSGAKIYAKQNGTADVFQMDLGTSGTALRVLGTGSSVGVGYFTTTSGFAGQITCSGTTTTYATSSDYRLKNITGPITTSGAYIDSLNPVEGTWKADGSTFVGLIAHEVQEASRTNVATGVKDGEQMQGMDYSSAEIIANLIAEIQSLRQRLAAAGI